MKKEQLRRVNRDELRAAEGVGVCERDSVGGGDLGGMMRLMRRRGKVDASGSDVVRGRCIETR